MCIVLFVRFYFATSANKIRLEKSIMFALNNSSKNNILYIFKVNCLNKYLMLDKETIICLQEINLLL